MVNVLVSVDPVTEIAPNSVSSAIVGVVSPSTIVVAFPRILISGTGVNPVPSILKL